MILEEEVTTLRAEVASLKEQLAQALAMVAQLQAELDKYRHQPPSFIKPNTPKSKDTDNSEGKTRRKRATDQNGVRRREQTPTQIVQHTIEECPDCGRCLSQSQLAGKRQVIELPPPQPIEVTEHQLYKSWCARCSKWHYPPLDLSSQVIGEGRSQSRMGVRIASLISYLRTSLRLPVRQIREYLLTMHGLLISTGEIVDLLHRVAEAKGVKNTVETIKERVRTSKVVHGDETGWRQKGPKRLHLAFLYAGRGALLRIRPKPGRGGRQAHTRLLFQWNVDHRLLLCVQRLTL